MVFKSFEGEKLQLMAELSHTIISRVRLKYKELRSITDELKETKTRKCDKLVSISSFYIIHAVALD